MKIYDGRESFAQWDMNMKVTDESFKVGEKIHFYNGTTENALVMLAYEYKGVVVADVPNIFFTLPLPIKVYRCVDEDSCSCTKETYTFEVVKRPKPDDYVYEQTEVYTIARAVEFALNECKESGEFDGRDGYTPQRGIDYWTESDQAEIKAYIDERAVTKVYGFDGVTIGERIVSMTCDASFNEYDEAYELKITSSLPIKPGSLYIHNFAMGFEWTDDGNGNLIAEGEKAGTVNYETGDVRLTNGFATRHNMSGSYCVDAVCIGLSTPIDTIIGKITNVENSISGVEEELAMLNEGGIE